MAQEYRQNIETPYEGKAVYIGNDWKPFSYKIADDAEKHLRPYRVRNHKPYH